MSRILRMKFPRGPSLLLGFLFTVQVAATAQAYGPLGHEIVGAIADERQAGTPTAAKIALLRDGISLEKASLMADEIKGWDQNGVDDPRSFHYSARRNIDKQLRDFWRANQPTHDANSPAPSHHWFHYTDVPVMPAQRYRDGYAGRSKWDIVHMIPFCIDVLQGRVAEQNERKITKPVALILLAHYVADIHQPLHVGAAYFDARPIPTRTNPPWRMKAETPLRWNYATNRLAAEVFARRSSTGFGITMQ